MRKIWMAGFLLMVAAGAVTFFYFAPRTKTLAGPVVVEDIQYPFEKGGGLVNVAVEDIFMGVGMLTGERKKDETRILLTGSVNFEPVSRKAQARLQIDRIRLMERTAPGKDGRIFEPSQVYDKAMSKGLEPEFQFPEGKGKLPFVWENGKSDCVYFDFKDIPVDLMQADLVITYNGKFPGKKHIAYYEDRLSMKRKSYFRNR
jgi:hypothetical protein